MAQKLYYENVYTKEFTSRVVSCEAGKHGYDVVLERTAFYPEGGGQPGDSGFIGDVRVTDTHERGGEIIHYCASPVEVGSELSCRIDWEKRFDLMQQHSGEHLISGIVHEKFGYDNVGFHMGADMITIDFDGEFTEEDMREIEARANAAIWENSPIEISYPSPEELKNMHYRSKKELTGEVRIVHCRGVDVCACCGTHVERTGEIGLVKMLSVQRFREGVRVEMLSGRRALEYLTRSHEQNKTVSGMLSAKIFETSAAVERMQAEIVDTKYRLAGCENKLFALKAAEFSSEENVVVFEDGLTPDAVRRLCDEIMKNTSGRVAVFSGSDDADYKYAVGQVGGDLRAFVKDMNAALSGRGGGKPFFAQGSVTAKREEIEKFFA